MAFTRVAKVADVPAGTVKGFVVDGRKIAIANSGSKLYAFEDRCTHAGAPLASGLLLGSMIMCIAHGAQFDLETGKPLTMVAKSPIKTFPVKAEGGDILVDL